MSGLHLIELYMALMKTWFAQNLQYRFALLIWLLGFILEPVVYLVVWTTVAQARGGSAGGFLPGDFTLYFIGAMLLNHLTFDWHFFEMEMRMRNGYFSPLLLRPVHPIHTDFADNIVYKAMTFPFMFAAAAGLCLYFQPEIKIPLWAGALFVPVLMLAFVMRFLLEWTISLLAFWTTRTQAIVTAYMTLAIFLSGRFTPLSLLPETMRHVAMWLPFRLWISFPAELLLGRITPEIALQNMLMQAVWIAILWVLLKVVWARGVRQYAAVGA